MGQPQRVSTVEPQGRSAGEFDAADVHYVQDTAYPGLKFFRCEPHRATLTTKGCASRWREAQDRDPVQVRQLPAREQQAARAKAGCESRAGLDVCRSCPIGAAHAGARHVQYSRIYGASICPRCMKGATRMIGGRVCVSCYNRARELAAGRNARGNAPVELLQRAPHEIELRIEVDGVSDRSRMVGVALSEVMIQTLRTTRGTVAFAFQGSDAGLRQGRLF